MKSKTQERVYHPQEGSDASERCWRSLTWVDQHPIPYETKDVNKLITRCLTVLIAFIHAPELLFPLPKRTYFCLVLSLV